MKSSRRQFLEKGMGCVGGLVLGAALPVHATRSLKTRREAAGQGLPAINAGVGGNNTIDLLNRIEKDCLAHRPALTILMAGTNDMNSVKHVPLAAYEENLSEMAGRIIAGAAVY
ncbi:hypothetical protein KRR40_46400 [Niabella defluvii]|nr:hypothetical protein KRR40_46400 [Niabella sp. I65]